MFRCRGSHQRSSAKKVFLEISQNSKENTCARVSFLVKVQACSFIKKGTLTQVFSCEFCKISQNTFLTEHLWATASFNERAKIFITSVIIISIISKVTHFFTLTERLQ